MEAADLVRFGTLSGLLVLALVMPYAKGAWGREAAVIVIGFPLLIALGAGAAVSPGVARVCRFSGELSYPLYMSHYAVIWIWGDFAEKHHLATAGLGPAVAVGVCGMLVFAWGVLTLYDRPVRLGLQRRFARS